MLSRSDSEVYHLFKYKMSLAPSNLIRAIIPFHPSIDPCHWRKKSWDNWEPCGSREKSSLDQWQSAGSHSLVLKHLFDRDLHRIAERGWIVAALKGEDHGHRPAGKNALDNGTDAFMRDPDVGVTVIDMDIIAR